MKQSIIVIAMAFTFLLPACQERKEDLKNPISETELYKKVGEEIPFETGMEWIEFYKLKNSKQGRTEALSSFQVPASEMKRVMNSVTNLTGIAFHYGIDGGGTTHILVIPVDESLRVWPSDSTRVLIDANTGTEISKSLANAWAQNYKDQHPTDIWFHFFGKDVFDEMSALPFFNSVDIEPAIDVLNLTPQLLLVVWNDLSISLGRTSDQDGVVYDASNPCPPCAVH